MKKEPRSPSTENAADAMLRLSGGGHQLSTGTSSSNPNTSCSSTMGVRAVSPGGSSNAGSMPLGPMTLKDEQYWVKRRKNNVAARRSREKRRINDAEMNIRIRQLIQQNQKLEDELAAIKSHFGLPVDGEFVAAERTVGAEQARTSATKKHSSLVHRGVPIDVDTPLPGSLEQNWSNLKTENLAESIHGESSNYVSASSGVTFITRPSVFPGLPHVTGRPSGLAYRGTADVTASIPASPPGELQPSSPIHQNPLHIDESHPDDQSRANVDVTKDNPRPYDDDEDEIDDSTNQINASYALQAMLKVKTEASAETGESASKQIDSEPETALSGFPAKMRYRNWRASEIDSASSVAAKLESTDSQASGSPPDGCSDNAGGSINGEFDASLPADDALRYIERRRRNNMAARKCRENRKKQNTMRVAKSTILETENNKLKMELKSLNDEYTSLYRLMENKKRGQISSSVGGTLIGQALVGQSSVSAADQADAMPADSKSHS